MSTKGRREAAQSTSKVGQAKKTPGHAATIAPATKPVGANERPRTSSTPRTKNTQTTEAERKNRRNKGLRFPEMHAALGDVLRTHRSKGNMSQSDVGMDADIDRGYISRVERAEQSPTIATLFAIAAKLGVPAWQLLKEAEESAATKH
jgi:ribosome-binding protein aMBF1 (putative translation factor)